MSARHLSALFHPASVALIGASERPGSLGEALARNLLAGDFKGEAHFINRRHRQILGRPAYHHLAEAPSIPDLAIIATPPPTVPRLLAEIGQHGVKVAVIATPARPGDGDPAALSRSTLLEAVQPHDLRLLGPGGGVIAPGRGCNLSLAPCAPPSGGLALVSQSGAALPPLIAWASAQGCGFSHLVVLGEQTDIDLADLLDWLAEDADTQVVLLALETVARARAFLSAARAAARVKPVLAVRAGGGHDAASRQIDAVYDAALRRAGVLRLPSLRELFWTALTLAVGAPIAGDRLAVVGNSRWLGSLTADTLRAEQGRLSRWSQDAEHALRSTLPPDVPLRNPLDLGDAADARRYAAALTGLLRERNADGLLVLHAPNARVSAEDVAAAVAETVRHHDAGGDSRPGVLACWPGADGVPGVRQRLRESRVPTYATPDDAVRAFMQCWLRQQNRIGLATTPAASPEPTVDDRAAARRIVEAALATDRDVLEPSETSALLRAYGLSASAAPEASVPGPAERPSLTFGVRMVEDPLFGPVLWLAVERADAPSTDAVAALPPLDPALAREALRPTLLYQLLRDADSAALGTMDGILTTLVKVSGLVVDLGEIVELELHLVVVNAAGIAVQDARIRLAASESAAHERLAIRPYPRELEESLPLPDGSTLLIRPVRPQDEPIFVASFKQLSTEEVRMRFLHALTELVHEEAARLTQIDYDRDLALVVFRQRPDQPLESCGVARLMRAADGERAEFALVLLRAATGIGLSSLLVRRLIHHARARGFRELFGEVLRENEPMLALCRAMGFHVAVCPDDAGLMIARLPLV